MDGSNAATVVGYSGSPGQSPDASKRVTAPLAPPGAGPQPAPSDLAERYVCVASMAATLAADRATLCAAAREGRLRGAIQFSGVRGGGGIAWFVPIAEAERLRTEAQGGNRRPWRPESEPEGRIALNDLVAIVNLSRKELGRLAVTGKIPTAQKINVGKAGKPQWFLAQRVADSIRRDAEAGRPQCWEREREKARRAATRGLVALCTLHELGAPATLSTLALDGLIPQAIQVEQPGRAGQRSQWFVPAKAARAWLDDARAGRPLPWHQGALTPEEIQERFNVYRANLHPDDCVRCRAIWGSESRPASLADFARRYEHLRHAQRRHLSTPFDPKRHAITDGARDAFAAAFREAASNGGFVRVWDLGRALGVARELSRCAAEGLLKTTVRRQRAGAIGVEARDGAYYIEKREALKIIADFEAGRPTPWEGARYRKDDVLRKRHERILSQPHRDCAQCRIAWGGDGAAPPAYEVFVSRYNELSRALRNHVGTAPDRLTRVTATTTAAPAISTATS